jgi:hypothetical protein
MRRMSQRRNGRSCGGRCVCVRACKLVLSKRGPPVVLLVLRPQFSPTTQGASTALHVPVPVTSAVHICAAEKRFNHMFVPSCPLLPPSLPHTPQQVQEAMDDWTANLGGGGAPGRRDRPQGWRDGQDRYGNQQERSGFARPRGLAAEPYQVRCVAVAGACGCRAGHLLVQQGAAQGAAGPCKCSQAL